MLKLRHNNASFVIHQGVKVGMARHSRSFISKWAVLLPVCAGVLTVGSSTALAQMPSVGPVEVATLVVTQQPVVLTTELPGRTSPYRIADIRPQVNGLILKRLFTEGTDVKAGDELYQIDPAPFQAALDNAKAALGRAEANLPAIQARFDRYKQALADKAVSQQDFDDASAALKQGLADIEFYKSSVRTAEINLRYAHIVSPISGRIGTSSVTDGAIVTGYQMTPLATVQQLDPIYVDVPQSTSQLLDLRRRVEAEKINNSGSDQNKVQIILEDNSKYPLEGTLQFRDVTVDPTTGSITLRVVVPNPNGVLLPGMFVRAIIKEGVKDQSILIPQQTVSRDSKGTPMAMVVGADGKVAARVLVIDRAIGNQWMVTSGLAPGDHIIAEGMQKARPGTVVKEVPFGQAPTQQPGAQPASTSK